MKVIKRTFEAKNAPKGSTERAHLNGNPVTSEYMPSYKYLLQTDDGGHTPFQFRTKAEAVAYMAESH